MKAFSGVRMWPDRIIVVAEMKVAAVPITKNAGSIVANKALFLRIFQISLLKGKISSVLLDVCIEKC